MTIIAPIYDIIVPQRATLREGPIWLPIDGRGCSFVAQVYADEKGLRKIFDMTVEVQEEYLVGADPENPDSIECQLELTAEWELTQLMKKDGFWDLLAIYPDNERNYWLQGQALIDRSQSRPAP